jgi:hypothetical protein
MVSHVGLAGKEEHDGEVFQPTRGVPVIAEVIRMLHKDTQDFVMHDELAEALLGHPIIKAIIARVHQQPDSPTSEWLVGNMIAWFSQKMTAATSPYRPR